MGERGWVSSGAEDGVVSSIAPSVITCIYGDMSHHVCPSSSPYSSPSSAKVFLLPLGGGGLGCPPLTLGIGLYSSSSK